MENNKFNTIYAKTDKNGSLLHTLIEHSVDVAERCYDLSSRLNNDDVLHIISYAAGIYHDIGKCAYRFQTHLKGKTTSKNMEHNVMGLYIFHNLCKYFKINGNDYADIIESMILHHHPYQDLKCDTLCESDKETALLFFERFSEIIKNKFHAQKIEIEVKDDADIFEPITTPPVYLTNDKTKGCILFYARNVLITADMDVTGRNDKTSICLDKMPDAPKNFDVNRYDEQVRLARMMLESKEQSIVLDAMTGFGKTLIGILYTLMRRKNLWWLCPKRSIAISIYHNIMRDLDVLGLSHIINVSLIYNGKTFKGVDNAHIKVAVIDSFLRPLLKSDGSLVRSYDILDDDCIIDEYHECLTSGALYATMILLSRTKMRYTDTKMIYMSATPNDNTLAKCVEGYMERCIRNSPDERYTNDMMNKKFMLHYAISKDMKPILDQHTSSCYVSINSIRMTQAYKQAGNVDDILHAGYSDVDKAKKLEKVLSSHGKDNNDTSNESLAATNIISTGVDISFRDIALLCPLPNRMIQDIGRIDRWGRHLDEISHIYIIDADTISQSDNAFLHAVSPERGSMRDVATEWMSCLRNHFKDGQIITRKDIYDLRNEFMRVHGNRQYGGDGLLWDLYDSYYNDSCQALSHLTLNYAHDNQNDVIITSSKPSLRNNDRDIFVRVTDYETRELLDDVFQVSEDIIMTDKIDDATRRIIVKSSLSAQNIDKGYRKNLERIPWEHIRTRFYNSSTPMILCADLQHILCYHKDLGLIAKNANFQKLVNSLK